MQNIKKNFGVYYIYCQNDWKNIFVDQVNAIFNSKILEKVDRLYLSINYNDISDLEYINKYIAGVDKIKISNSYTQNYFEFEALRVVQTLCLKYNCNVFYMHTKGAGISEANKSFYHNATDLPYLLTCVASWRKFMESYLLHKADLMLSKLVEYDACGVNLCEEPKKHFSGNFWWARSEYVNKLPKIDLLERTNRWAAEFWIGSGDGAFLNLESNSNAGYNNIIK